MIPYAREIGAAVVLAAILGAGWAGWEWRDRSADIEAAEAKAKAEKIIGEFHKAEREASERARMAEQRRAEDLAALDRKHAQELQDAQDRSDRRISGLESGNVRLRHEIGALYTERLSRDSAAAGELSDTAKRGAELVAAAVGVGAQCDARQRALIKAYEAMRRPAP